MIYLEDALDVEWCGKVLNMFTIKNAFDQVMTGEKDESDPFFLNGVSKVLDGRHVKISDIDDLNGTILFFDNRDNEFEIPFQLIDDEIILGSDCLV